MAAAASLTVADWHRLNRLLATALELEGADRTAWLDALGDEDKHLRAVLVDLLNRADMTVADGPPTQVAQLATAALASMRAEQSGDRVGPWRLERLLVEGGMGAVWEAARADGVMQRRAALKLPRAEWVDRGLAERIARERAILARLQHPHIAVLYDAGVTAEGRPYLALEYVAGVPIDAYCKGRELKEVVRLFVQVVRAVAYAHAQLVIHRDLKPANVLVTAEGTPKLLDFGISKLIEGEALAADATALTRLAGRPLTLAYAAPEQVLSLPITVAADVYALGVMLAELITEARLYRSSTPRELEAELLRGDLRAPSALAADKVRAKALKGDLDAIVSTALKRQPAERYQSATALADDLESYLTGQPVKARPDSRAYRLKKFVVRNRLPVAAGSAVLVALGIGLGVALWQADAEREQANLATALNTFVLGLIRQADPNASAQTKQADLALLQAIEQRIDQEFKGSPDQLLQLRVTVGDAYRNRGETAAAQRVYQRAIDEASRHLPADDLMMLTARVRTADFNVTVSMKSAHELAGVIEILRSKADSNPAAADLLVDALLFQRALSWRFGVPSNPPSDPAELKRLEREPNEIATRYFGEGSRQQLKALAPFARAYGKAEAMQRLESALEHARKRTDVEGSVEYLQALTSYGWWLCETDQLAAGVRVLWDVIETVNARHGSDGLQLEVPYTYIGNCLHAVGDPTAVGLIVQAYEIASARERPPSLNLMRRAGHLGNVLINEKRPEEAKRVIDVAIANLDALADARLRQRFLARQQGDLVLAMALLGETEDAEKLAQSLVPNLNLQAPEGYGIRVLDALSFAQRVNGRPDAAMQTAATIESACAAVDYEEERNVCLAGALMLRALAANESGQHGLALNLINDALSRAGELWTRVDTADLRLAAGRIVLANGRPEQAIDYLRAAYGFWLSHDPKSVWASEAEYWLGRAYIVNGDVKRGRWMVAEAQKALATSKLRSHRALTADANLR